jgi:hypothetical protein
MKERIVRAVAGIIVLVSIGLAYFVNIQWLWLGVFVGFNQILPARNDFGLLWCKKRDT